LRGPGEYLGARQSGAPLLRFADLTEDADLIEPARSWPRRFSPTVPSLQNCTWSAGSAGELIF